MKPYESKNIPFARELRKGMTDQERKLWYKFLKVLPIKFYRQRPIGNYIVDFYCNSLKLVIEIDGGQHYDDEALKYDKERTKYLISIGLKVLRFTNRDIDMRLDNACEAIWLEIEKRTPPTPHLCTSF